MLQHLQPDSNQADLPLPGGRAGNVRAHSDHRRGAAVPGTDDLFMERTRTQARADQSESERLETAPVGIE